MVGYYDEVEIEDMTWDEDDKVYHYPCPCGDRFEISRAQLAGCEDIATCPSCSLIIRVIYDPLDYEDDEEEEDDHEASSAEESEPKEKDNVAASVTSVVATELSGAVANMKLTDGDALSKQSVPIKITEETTDGTNGGPKFKDGSKSGIGVETAALASSVDVH